MGCNPLTRNGRKTHIPTSPLRGPLRGEVKPPSADLAKPSANSRLLSSQLRRERDAKAQGAGECVRLPHAHLRRGAFSAAAAGIAHADACRRAAVPNAPEADWY